MDQIGSRDLSIRMSNHRTKLRSPPKVTEEDSGVGPSLSPSACLPEPFQFSPSIRFFDTVEKVCTSGENFNWENHDLQFKGAQHH